ncbi:hypothetical protein BS78_08G132200 [Paspalum vaginatum]|nr:hypothetical protein BS78_08G132200 [Paspalum vaginatum]
MENRRMRRLEVNGTCRLCGNGEENGYHAVVVRTKARALRAEVKKEWSFFPEHWLVDDGPDWLLLLLDKLDVEQRVQLLFWHSWFLRNDAIHGTGSASVYGSAHFIMSYKDSHSLLSIRQGFGLDHNGKKPVNNSWRWMTPQLKPNSNSNSSSSIWEPPLEGWAKIDVDGAFTLRTGAASIGGIIRDYRGHVLLSFWQILTDCSLAEQSVVLESDCASVIATITTGQEDRSHIMHMVTEIKACAQLLPELGLVRELKTRLKNGHGLDS